MRGLRELVDVYRFLRRQRVARAWAFIGAVLPVSYFSVLRDWLVRNEPRIVSAAGVAGHAVGTFIMMLVFAMPLIVTAVVWAWH